MDARRVRGVLGAGAETVGREVRVAPVVGSRLWFPPTSHCSQGWLRRIARVAREGRVVLRARVDQVGKVGTGQLGLADAHKGNRDLLARAVLSVLWGRQEAPVHGPKL